MELGRIIELVDGESHAMIRKRWLTKLFVCGDVVSFTLQMAGTCSHPLSLAFAFPNTNHFPPTFHVFSTRALDGKTKEKEV